MKTSFNLLLGFMLTMTILSCKKDQDVLRPEPDTTTGNATPVGTPEGSAVMATIGPAGGTIRSADQRIQVTIPAGALSSNQNISVQPITNHIPSGTGRVFRLLPHGITFSKPVSITFQYDETDVDATAPEVLRIAYQNDKGIWYSPSLKSIDTTAHTLTVQTNHFSDWGLFKSLFVDPKKYFLNPGESIQLSIYQSIEEIENNSTDDLVVPLVPKVVPAKYIEKWTLYGAGTLSHTYNKGTYYAPSSIPSINPTNISVQLSFSATIGGVKYKDLRLTSNIFVAPEGISVQINGGGWKTYPGGANINSSQNVVLGKIGDESASVTWQGNPTGTYKWTMGTTVAFNLVVGPVIYQHLYVIGPGQGAGLSGGTLKTDNTHNLWATGTFDVPSAGWVNPTTPLNSYGKASIKGVFRVKRTTGL